MPRKKRTPKPLAASDANPDALHHLRDLLVALGFDRGSASILAVLHTRGKPCDTRAIRDTAGISPYLISTTLKGLTAAGIVEVSDAPIGEPRRGRPMWTLRLTRPLTEIIAEKTRTERDHIDAAEQRILEVIG